MLIKISNTGPPEMGNMKQMEKVNVMKSIVKKFSHIPMGIYISQHLGKAVNQQLLKLHSMPCDAATLDPDVDPEQVGTCLESTLPCHCIRCINDGWAFSGHPQIRLTKDIRYYVYSSATPRWLKLEITQVPSKRIMNKLWYMDTMA